MSTISDPKLLGPRYNINWNSKSAEQGKAFWLFEGRTKQCSDSSVVRDMGDPDYRIAYISGLLRLVSKLSDIIYTCLALDLANTARTGHFTDSVRMNLAAVFIRLKKRKKRRYYRITSLCFQHVSTTLDMHIYRFSHDKAHILKFRTLAFFHKLNF